MLIPLRRKTWKAAAWPVVTFALSLHHHSGPRQRHWQNASTTPERAELGALFGAAGHAPDFFLRTSDDVQHHHDVQENSD